MICLVTVLLAFAMQSATQDVFDGFLVGLSVDTQSGSIIGSGFTAGDQNKYIVTADHVIVNEVTRLPFDSIWAVSPLKTSLAFRLKIVKRFSDVGRDIAVLSFNDGKPLTGSGLRISTTTPKAGESVQIGGFPLVFDKVLPFPFLRSGIIASTRFNLNGIPILMLDLTAVPGFSGSPVVTKHGVIGVFIGYPKNRQGTNFSVAAPLSPEDLQNLEPPQSKP